MRSHMPIAHERPMATAKPSKKPFTAEDLYLHRKVLALHGLAGQQAAVFVVRTVDREGDGYFSHLWCSPGRDAPPRQLTFGGWKDQSPRLGPDGKRVAFISSRTGVAKPYLLDMAGGEAKAIGRFDTAASTIRWMPDCSALLVTANVPVDPELRGRRSDKPPPKRGPKAPEVAWKLPYKMDGSGYLLANEVHLFHLDIASGERRQLTDGPFQVYGFDAAPDGKTIAYVRTREGRFSHANDLWTCGIDGRNHRQVTTMLDQVMPPAWSPDGRWIAMLGSDDEADARCGLYLLEVASGDLRRIGNDDIEFGPEGELQWSADGAAVYALQTKKGRHELVRVAIPSGEIETVVGGDRQLGAFAVASDRVLFSVHSPEQPSEVLVAGLDGSGERVVTELNPWWNERVAIRCESRTFDVPDGEGGTETIHGWLLHADDGQSGPLPLLNDAHGGPASYALLDYDTNVFWQVLCSRGWAVLALDAAGSATYGKEFCDRLDGRWGELDLPQHLAAIGQLQEEGICDDRIAITGKSYGGFFSSWAVGHTDVFRAAIVMAPVGNIETHYGTSDGGYYADPMYVSGTHSFDRHKARQLSPLQSIEKAKTPTLFIQGKDDERCPKCQSEELFVSLMRAGDTPTELVLYPGEDHHFLGEGAPSVRQDAAERIVDWVEKHVRAGSKPAAERETASVIQAASVIPAEAGIAGI
jgi:dipeptidyl aminopeptidase/acylaminoacyl peptidase